MRFTLDSNILIYALFAGDRRHQRAVDVVEHAAQMDCVIMLQCLGESFRVLTGKRGLDVADAGGKIARLRRLMPVACADPTALDMAIDVIVRHKLSFWDAMIWATAKLAGCRVIVTEDNQDGRDLDGVLYLSPFRPENDKVLRMFLPDLPKSSPYSPRTP